MKSEVAIGELKSHVSEFVRAAQDGSEIVIKDGNTPIARLVPIERKGMLGNVRYATRSMAEAQQMLDALLPLDPPIPADVFERVLEEEKADRSYE